jgi:hypothetical protein
MCVVMVMRWLPGGLYRALGRVDDTMNLGGIMLRCLLKRLRIWSFCHF